MYVCMHACICIQWRSTPLVQAHIWAPPQKITSILHSFEHNTYLYCEICERYADANHEVNLVQEVMWRKDDKLMEKL